MTGGPAAWPRRLSFAAVLAVSAAVAGSAPGAPSPGECGGRHCEAAGTVLWARRLPGQWVVRSGLMGTMPAHGPAYAAFGADIAAVGTGLAVEAYQAGTGKRLWTTELTGLPPGSAIISVRVWPGVVTAGVSLPAAAGPGQGRRQREEVVLRAGTGHRVRAFPAALFGGAVAAGKDATVIVGTRWVTSYSNANGKIRWRRRTGAQPQAWQIDGHDLYVTVAADGYLGAAPVTALRRIDMRTGRLRLVRPRQRAFAGRLGLAFDGVVLFTDATGVTAYSGESGKRLWHRDGALPESVDARTGRLYLLNGNVLSGVAPRSGRVLSHVSGVAAVASSGLYGVRGGVVLGLDHGSLGKAWGYDAAANRVTWTSKPLPWAHYFVDLSGIGGSASPSRDAVLFAVCADLRAAPAGSNARRCTRPELVALSR